MKPTYCYYELHRIRITKQSTFVLTNCDYFPWDKKNTENTTVQRRHYRQKNSHNNFKEVNKSYNYL